MAVDKKIIVAICGASGAIYGVRLVRALLMLPVEVHLIVSSAGRLVMTQELGAAENSMDAFLKAQGAVFHERAVLYETDPDDFMAGPASGSFHHDGMVVIPCSMNTLASVANGLTRNLIHRAADVSLKEKRPLILAVRETPLNLIHLENMVRAAQAGATVLPLSPGFYFHPQRIEDLVDALVEHVMAHLGIAYPGMRRWGDPESV